LINDGPVTLIIESNPSPPQTDAEVEENSWYMPFLCQVLRIQSAHDKTWIKGSFEHPGAKCHSLNEVRSSSLEKT
jgi:hypothetical protein